MKKSTRRQIKKTSKVVRKALKRAKGPMGVATGALTLGGLAAVAMFDPSVRARSRELVDSTRSLLRQLRGKEEHEHARAQPLLQHAH